MRAAVTLAGGNTCSAGLLTPLSTGAQLGAYADEWAADSPQARLMAADRIAPRLPPTGWLDRALTDEGLFVETVTLLSEWPI